MLQYKVTKKFYFFLWMLSRYDKKAAKSTGTSTPMLHSLNTCIHIKGTHAMTNPYEKFNRETNMMLG